MPIHANFGLVVFTVTLGALCAVQGSVPECRQDLGIMKIQQLCEESNSALTEADQQHDKEEVCRQHTLATRCVAENVPECFEMYDQMNAIYLHSPYNCQIDAEELQRLQAILARSEDGQVDVVPLPTDAEKGKAEKDTTPDTAPQPWTKGGGDDAEGDGYSPSVIISDSGHSAESEVDGAEKGTREGHTGSQNPSDGSSRIGQFSPWSLLLLVVLCRLLYWRES